jgi:double-stranded uracil-DNA glycosylase
MSIVRPNTQPSHNARLFAFAPIAGHDARVLVLGSMPGIASLREQRYYAHPQNAFWPIASAAFGFEPTLDYEGKVAALVAARVAVWDVLHACEREGSLDSAIVRESEVANDFHAFLDTHKEITRVCFNGGVAEQLFKRHCASIWHEKKYELVRLPSTSPANASVGFERKLAAWRAALVF